MTLAFVSILPSFESLKYFDIAFRSPGGIFTQVLLASGDKADHVSPSIRVKSDLNISYTASYE